MIRQSQSQKLLQKLSPQQIQLMKLLQIPTVNLEERIKEEIEENPALEYEEGGDKTDDNFDLDTNNEQEDFNESEEEVDLTDDTSEKVELDDFLKHEDDGDYNYGDDYYGGEKEQKTIPIRVENSFHEQLLNQLNMLELEGDQLRIAEQIIGSIDDDGYLRREHTAIVDDLAFGQNIQTTVEEIKEIIQQIQDQFDPPGVCAVTLQECLLLQLKRLPKSQTTKNAIEIIDHYYEEFIKKHYDKIQKYLNLDDEEFKSNSSHH